MKKPYFLIGAVLLFWGFMSGNIWIGVLAGILLEASYFIKKKIDFTDESYIRIADLTSVIFIASIFIIYFNVETVKILPTLAKWMPMMFILLVAAEMYSVKNYVIIGTRLGKKEYTHQPMSIFFPFIAITLFSTTTLNIREDYFFVLLFMLTAWAIWQFRNRRYSKVTYAVLTILFFGISFWGEKALVTAYTQFRDKMYMNYREGFIEKMIRMRSGQYPFEGTTAIGNIGEIKLSGRIIFRVELEKNINGKIIMPDRVKDNIYDIYSPPNWSKKSKIFKDVLLDDDGNWILKKNQAEEDTYKMKISQNIYNKKGLIPLPKGSFKINNLQGTVEADRYETVRISETARLVNYEVLYNPKIENESKPEKSDLMLLNYDKEVIDEIAKSLGIINIEPKIAVSKIADYFHNNFKYTLIQERRRYRSYMKDFLLNRKAGHCEYFATATVLLLREAGIPARYVTGYVVQERSLYEKNVYIVRERHGHAWAEAFIDGKWITVDNTPSVWFNEDEKRASNFEKITDFFEFIKYEITTFFTIRSAKTNFIITSIIVVLLLILAIRIYLQQRGKGNQKNLEFLGRKKTFKILESDFELIRKELEKLKIPKMNHETFYMWVKRIDGILRNADYENSKVILTRDLIELIGEYNRLRYDPKSFSDEELWGFNKNVRIWLEKWNSANK